MNNKANFIAGLPLLALFPLLLCSKANAHFPTLSCHYHQQESKPKNSHLGNQQVKSKLVCEAGYSDASLAGNVKLKVFSYDDTLLLTVITASDGSVTLTLPQGEYYIVFDPGHESPAEFDYAELQ